MTLSLIPVHILLRMMLFYDVKRSSCISIDVWPHEATQAWCGEGGSRQSWDPLTLLAAVRGPAKVGCLEEGKGGRNVIDQRGNNHWRGTALNGTNQSYLVIKVKPQIP